MSEDAMTAQLQPDCMRGGAKACTAFMSAQSQLSQALRELGEAREDLTKYETHLHAVEKALATVVAARDSAQLSNAELRGALEDIKSWDGCTLQHHPDTVDTEPFDRGARMAFYRCAERARTALASSSTGGNVDG